MSETRSAFGVLGSAERVPLLPEEWTNWRGALGVTLRRLLARALGLTLITAAVGAAVAIVTYVPTDPSWNTASGAIALNALGLWGANVADAIWQSIGVAGWIAVVPPFAWGLWLVDGRVGLRLALRVVAWLTAIALIATSLALFPALSDQNAQTNMGGVVGDLILPLLADQIEPLGIPTPATISGVAAGIIGLGLLGVAGSAAEVAVDLRMVSPEGQFGEAFHLLPLSRADAESNGL